MSKYEQVIQMLMNGISRELAVKLVKEFCPHMFGLKNDEIAVREYGCTRCDMCWGTDKES